jgi:hypothetical protein
MVQLDKRLKALGSILPLLIIVAVVLMSGCLEENKVQQTADSGVQKATVKVQTDAQGLTIEQKNIIERYKRDNQPGSFKYLYCVNAYTNDVVYMSTVKGKVTSSGKRLTPRTLSGGLAGSYWSAMQVIINGEKYYTTELIEDDGTYGDSVPYLYWFDANDVYHQQYINGGSIIHVTDQPLVLPKAVMDISVKTQRHPNQDLNPNQNLNINLP